MTDTQHQHTLRTNAVRSSATEFDATVQPDDFDDWLRREHGAAWTDGYRAGKHEAQR